MRKPLKLLLVSFYYPPDLSAGSFRTEALVHALQRSKCGTPIEIEVLTTSPNRYSDIAKSMPEMEIDNGVKVHRVQLPAHSSGMIDQSRAFLTFARWALSRARQSEFDLVFATSSRLMTALLGVAIGRRKRVPVYLDIRDLFVDTLKDVFSGTLKRAAVPFFQWAESWAFKRATRISVNSPGFVSHVQKIVPNADIPVFTNGIDPLFLEGGFKSKATSFEEPVSVLYAGNIGEGQGLDKIVPLLADKFRGRVHFKIVGAGGQLGDLRSALEDKPGRAVELLPPVPRKELMQLYQKADILFVHLNNYSAFEKVIPSKLFEYGATGKPILAGVSGQAASFVSAHLPDVQLFEPCNLEQAEDALDKTLRGPNAYDRGKFRAGFDRLEIMDQMAADILVVAQNNQVAE